MISEHVAAWSASSIAVGCSGNFTVERVLTNFPRFELHSNDITIYSSILGCYFAGQPFRIALHEEFEEDFGWLRPYLADPVGAVASIMLATRLTEGLRADGSLKRNSYYDRMRSGTREQWPILHAKTVDKLKDNPLHLASFYCGDVVDWLATVGPEVAVISYPPFFGAARDYEHMFARLDTLFDWDQPLAVPTLTDERFKLMLQRLTNRPQWIFGNTNEWPDYKDHLRGIAQTTNRGLPIYIYASHGGARVVAPRQDTTPVTVPRLAPGQAIGSQVAIAPLAGGQFRALRSQYMNPHIRPGQETASFAVLVDGYLVGVFAVSTAPNPALASNPEGIYLLSDFPVAPTDYPRLSKLVLYVALSKEAKLLFERIARRRIKTTSTTAYSKNPVSMKYRGLFDLIGRQEVEDGVDGQRFKLQYSANLGKWSAAEGLTLWAKKFGERSQGVAHANADH